MFRKFFCQVWSNEVDPTPPLSPNQIIGGYLWTMVLQLITLHIQLKMGEGCSQRGRMTFHDIGGNYFDNDVRFGKYFCVLATNLLKFITYTRVETFWGNI